MIAEGLLLYFFIFSFLHSLGRKETSVLCEKILFVFNLNLVASLAGSNLISFIGGVSVQAYEEV